MRAVLLVVLFAVGCGKPGGKTDGEALGKQPVRKTYTRDQFRQLVIGKTPDEVIKAVGKPDRTQDFAGTRAWYYDRITTDPITGKVDRTSQVIFEQGVADRVTY